MAVRFDNISEIVRCNLENDIEYIHNKYHKEKDVYRAIKDYFHNLKKQNKKLYKNILGLLISDDYKLLYIRNQKLGLPIDEKERLYFYQDLAFNEISSYLELNPEILIHCLYEMSEFNGNDYFSKRTILNDCKTQKNIINGFSCFCIYDFLYYCQLYNLEKLKEVYNNSLSDGNNQDEAVASLVVTLRELSLADRANYKDVIIELLNAYYMIGKNDLFNYAQINLIPFIEGHTPNEIQDYLSDNRTLFEVLKSYINFDGDIKELSTNDAQVIKTLQKIKRIKEN